MRKTGNKKEEISTSKKMLSVCLSVALVLGSLSALAFADGEDADAEVQDQPAVVEPEVVDEATPAVVDEEPAEVTDEEEPAAVDAEVAEDAEEQDGDAVVDPAEEADAEVAEEEQAEVVETISVPTYNAPESITDGKIYYVGDSLPAAHNTSANRTYFKFGDTTMYVNGGTLRLVNGTFRNQTNTSTYRPEYGNLTIAAGEGDAIGIKVTRPDGDNPGSQSNPYTVTVEKHVHSWALTVSNQNKTCTVSCTAARCPLSNSTRVATVSIAANGGTYNGSAFAATLTQQIPNIAGLTVSVSDITYTGTDTEGTDYSSTDAPLDAGSYTASATVTVGEASETISATFTINKAYVSYSGVTWPTAVQDGLTDLGEIVLPQGGEVELIVAGSMPEANGGKFVYSTDGTTFSEDVPTTSEALENVTVSFKIQPDKNHTTFDWNWEIPDITVMNYYFVSGDNSSWTQGSTENVVITVKRSNTDTETIDRFTALYVDGEEVNDSSYNKEAGSVILTIGPEYLKTLSVGDHTVKVGFQDGTQTYELSTKITIKAAPTPAPQTGEYAGALVLIASAILVAAGAAFVVKAKKA
ncbi:MAG: hypothetical protein J6Z43_04830 [Clostridiales bacterium]|nr:hypothetical protein [Clostridiales bacterium]